MTDFKALVAKPKDFKVEEVEFRSSNNVFQAHYGTGDYVVKNPGLLNDLLDRFLYCPQDKCFYGNRRHAEAKLRLDQEVETLQELGKIDGVNVPTFAHYARERRVLVLDYIEGRDFRHLTVDEQYGALEGAMEQLELIHSKGLFVGNAHTKKIRLAENGKVYWVGFCSLYEQDRNIVRSQAIDLLKFAYSTYMASNENKGLTEFAAMLASQHNDESVREELRDATDIIPKGWKLKWTTRMPKEGKLSQRIKSILFTQNKVRPLRAKVI